MIYGTPTIVTNGLVFYVDAANPMSYTSGSTTWSNISGYGSNGTLTRNNAFSDLPLFDVTSKSLIFTGSIFTPDSSNANLTGSRCIFSGYNETNISGSNPVSVVTNFMFRNYPTVASRSGGYDINNSNCILVKNSYSPSYGIGIQYSVASTPPSGSWTQCNVFCGVRSSFTPTTSSFVTSNTILLPNTWYNTCMTSYWDGTKQITSLYINGRLDNTNTSTTQLVQFWNNGTISMGGLAVVSGNGIYGNVTISNGMIYNRALSPSEITQNYNALKSRFNLT